MSNPGLFKDLNKRTNDLLTKEYPSDKKENRAEWKGTTSSGLTTEITFVHSKSGIVGTLLPKYKLNFYGAEASAEITSKRDIKAEINFADQPVKGLKTTVTANSKDKDVFVTLGDEYKHEAGTFNATIDYGKAKGSTLSAATVIGVTKGLSLGVSADYFLGGSKLQGVQGVAAYKTDEFDLTAFARVKSAGEEDKTEVGLTYFHKVNSDLSVGTDATFDVSNEVKPKFTFGVQYALNPDTTVKGKLDNQGQFALSYTQKFNKHAKVTVSGGFDTNNFSGKDSANYGVALYLND